MKQNYRLYSLTNSYLSSLQKGLQTAHVVSDLALTAAVDSQVKEVFDQWAEQDKTIVILNGGNSASLQEFERFLRDTNCQWPWAAFREDEQSLNGAITAVGIIMPEVVYLYDGEEAIDIMLATRLKQLSLAV